MNSAFSLSQKELENLKNQLEKRSSVLLSKMSGKKFSRIHKLIGKNNKASQKKAIELLKNIVNSSSSSKGEKAKAYSFLGRIYIIQADYKKAITFFEKYLSSNVISLREYLGALLSLSYIHVSLGNIKKAKTYLKRWFALTNEDQAKPHAFMAQIEYMSGNKKKALSEILKAIKMVETPSKQWLSFATHLYIEFEDYSSAETYLKRTINLYPSSEEHWRKLSTVQLTVNKKTEPLASYQIAEKIKPLDKENQVLQLVSLFSDQGIPFSAAKYLKKSLDKKIFKSKPIHYEMLGDAWWQAKEKTQAVKAWEASSDQTTDNGRVDKKLGQIYLQQEKWEKAVQKLKKSLKLGGMEEQKDEIYFYLGLAYFNLKNYNEAINYFQKAEELQGSYEIVSGKWIRDCKKNLL